MTAYTNNSIISAIFRAEDYKSKYNRPHVTVLFDGTTAIVSLSPAGTKKKISEGWEVIKTL